MSKKKIYFPNYKTTNKNYMNDYINHLILTLKNVKVKNLNNIKNIIQNTIKNDKYLFVCGNGGSASISNHLTCDIMKGINSSNDTLKPKIISLSSSNELITAIGNDINFNEIFSYQIHNLARKGDCIIFFSCSGTSKNIIRGIEEALNKKLKVVLFTGFCNKKLKKITHINFNCKNYGIVEDIFSSIIHMISQNIRFNKIKNKKDIIL